METLTDQTNNTPAEAPQDEKKQKRNGAITDILDVVQTVFVAIFVVVLLFAYIIRPVTVDGSSMESTLQSGDKLLMEDFFYTPKRGDIVILDNTYAHLLDSDGNVIESEGLGLLGDEQRLIKRIIAVGGETLDIDFSTGDVIVDGEVLEEPYINNMTSFNEGAFEFPITIPEGYYFVMGDNRQNSTDSRSYYVGLVPEDAILGKAIFRFTPGKMGSIYKNMTSD